MDTFVRTVLGDIKVEDMGVTYSHEHIVIDDSYPTQSQPNFLLNDIQRIVTELKTVYRLGGRTMVDTMPANCGRNVLALAEVSRRSGIQIIAPTGIHLEMYYPTNHWRYLYSVEELVEMFIADIEIGIDRLDYGGPIVKRSPHKAGLLKLATGDGEITSHQKKIFEAVALAHHRTGCPILTHSNAGLQAMSQVKEFDKWGVDLSKVVISHVDRRKDIEYHRELLKSGVNVEYDSCFRWKEGEDNWTMILLEALLPEFPYQITLGMDAARHSYWHSYGGSPGLGYLLTDLVALLKERDLLWHWRHMMVDNPASIFSFKKG
ncbi:phosphotriesterase family protein [Membranihabitans marinus]|uniref:phosphotriesterase family protein n=1 Tax=Membranihabitans marinus TaxID=1227546 RepID=UPI001F21D42B|nr:aryldialkylphosphatase [Membranihabitans marinus]